MIRELSQDEKQSIESSENYLNFIGKSSKFIERVLSEKIDLFTEYDSKIEENRLFIVVIYISGMTVNILPF